ncbi:MAG TPA: hypothetical protein VMV10_19225 [Pirellulales bacterium]|nr:hypothetical protein [Pirellulales bacterium]
MSLAFEQVFDPPQLVVWLVEFGNRLAKARQMVELAGLLGLANLPFDERFPGHAGRFLLGPAHFLHFNNSGQFLIDFRNSAKIY